MNYFEIDGNQRLSGTIVPQGAKNEALQILSAVLLTDEKMTIHQVPNILDVNALIDLLKEIGVSAKSLGKGSWEFEAKNVDIDILIADKTLQKGGMLRGSVLLAGAMLSRFKKAYMPQPGGDKIGRRRLDTHLLGFEKLGIDYAYNDEKKYYVLDAKNARQNNLLLDEPSVTGTANIIFAALTIEGITTIYNAACEPYIQQLCKMLNRMGAKISGIGSNLLTIEGVKKLHGTTHTMLPDMIEIGSFIGMAAMTKSSLTIANAGVQHLGIIPERFKQLGIKLEIIGDDIFIPDQDVYEIQDFLDGSILTIYDHPWPGLTPDLLSIFLVVATQARGSVLIHQKMFESRLFFVDKLIDMGAKIIMCDPHRATVIGLERKTMLRGITMTSPDIRAGVALLIAALSATGKSKILNIEQIDRGYENIEARLQSLGARIERKKSS